MRRPLNPQLFIGFLCALFCFTSCVEDRKDLYDPNVEVENPMGTIDVPDNFDWKTTTTFELEVKVADKFNNQYGYLIEAFESNPVITPNLKAIVLGYAKGNSSFKTTVTVPKGVQHLYVRQTTPDQLSSVRSIGITDGGKVVCDFSSLNATRAAVGNSIATRAESIGTINEPTLPDVSNAFPTSAPADAVVHTGNDWITGSDGAYKKLIINSSTKSINAGRYCEFYITEDLNNATVIDGLKDNSDRKIYIMPGVTVNMSRSLALGTRQIFSIGEGAKLIVNGEFKSGTTGQTYNAGTISAQKVHMNTNTMLYNTGVIESTGVIEFSYNFYNVGGEVTGVSMKVDQREAEHFYNSGTITLSGNATGETMDTGNNVAIYNTNSISVEGNWKMSMNAALCNKNEINVTGTMHLEDPGNKLINDGDIKCADFSLTAGAKSENNGLMTVAGLTDLQSADVWINNGTWVTETMETYATKSLCINSCKLIVNDEFRLREATFINDAGSYVYTNNLFMHRSTVNMLSAAFFDVNGTATLAENWKSNGQGFYGDNGNTERALLRMTKADVWSQGAAAPQKIYYTGKMTVMCTDHFLETNGYDVYWVMDGGAEWASDKGSISIPQSECNPGWKPDPDPDPETPDPDPSVDPYTYSYLFEDMWPLYGDYDMNDMVLRINNITTVIDANNQASKFSFDASIRAIGAEKRMGGAVMLDNIQASAVKSVSYSINTPTTFNVSSTGVEQNQTKAVIPLFDHVHKFMGKENAWFINTNSSPDNVANPPVMTVTIEFATPVNASDLNSAYLNFFVITDITGSNPKPVNKSPRREIHIVDYKPTAMAETSIFGNNNDGSNPSAGKYYRSKDGLPWGIVVPSEFKWPYERIQIMEAYTQFEEWVTSGGASNQEWWKYPSPGKIYN